MVIAVEDWHLVYAAVPKAGCSSVKAMLAKVDPKVTLPAQDEVTNSTYHSLYPTRRFHKWSFDRHKNAFRFTVIRDPIKRLMSVYTNRVVGQRDLHKSRRLRRRGVLPLDPDFFFLNYRRYMRLSSIIHHHILPTNLFTGPDLKLYDRVFRTDQIGDLAKAISNRTGKSVSAEKVNSSALKLSYDDLTSETRDVIRPFLASEYKFLAGHLEHQMDDD